MAAAIFETLRLLESKGVHYYIERTREDTVRICATFVGQRVEIEVFEDNHLEISRFYGDESIDGGMELLLEILRKETD